MRSVAKPTTGLILILMLAACAPGGEEDAAVLLRVDDDPTITFKVWFRVGSQDDPPGKAGLAALTGEMIADAGTTDHSYEEILELLHPLAAGYGMRVGREMSVLTGRIHRDNLAKYEELFNGAFLRPAFREEDFERIKSDTLNYLENTLRYQADEELGKAALYSFVFEGTPYAHPPEGTLRGVESITLDDVKAFYQAHYTRENATIAVGGGFDDALVERFRAAVKGLPAGEAAAAPAVQPEPIEGLSVLLVAKPDADASISFGFPITASRGEREFYALWIANSWLGEHRSSASHLYQVIREARGMNYGDYSYIEAYTEGGYRSVPPSHVARRNQIFEVWIRTLPNERAHFALRAAMRELKKLVDDGMSQEEFELTRSFLRKYVLHFADTTQARLAYALDDRFYGIEEEGHLARFRRMMDEITLEEVNAAIRKHFQYENVKIAMVTGEAESLREALVSDAASPIRYDSPKPEEVLAEDVEIAEFPLKIGAEAVRVLPVEEIFAE